MPKRWYDKDATISLAISMLKKASEDNQQSVCEYLQKEFSEVFSKKSDKFIVFKVFNKRWYDEKENVYNLIENIRCCDDEMRRTLALSIINHLCNIVVV